MTVAIVPAKPFKNAYLSVSRLGKFEQCPKAFWFAYIEKAPRIEGDRDAAEFGSLLHLVLERLYQWIVREEHTGKLPDDLLDTLYRDAWEHAPLKGVDVYAEGIQLLRVYVAQQGAFDHTQILATELEFRIPVGEFEIFGKIDRVDKLDDETIEVIDYKSNRVLFTHDEVEHNLQLAVYQLVVQRMFPWAKHVRLAFHMLRHRCVLQTERSPEQLDDVQDYLVAIGRKTERSQTYPAKLSRLCGWCDHRHLCDAYRTASDQGDAVLGEGNPNDMPALASLYERVSRLQGLLDKRKKDLAEQIKEHLKSHPELRVGGMTYRLITYENKSYPIDATVAKLAKAFELKPEEVAPKIAKVENASIAEFVKAHAAEKKWSPARVKLFLLDLEGVAKKRAGARMYSSPDKGATVKQVTEDPRLAMPDDDA